MLEFQCWSLLPGHGLNETNLMTKRALLCWELGEGTGHVYPYLSLLRELKRHGWEIAVAAKNTAEVAPGAQAVGATLFQAPVCIATFSGLDPHSFNYTEMLLHYGYGHVPVLNGLFAAWRGLLESWRPDLVIGSAAPTAHLAAQSLGIADIAIGSGFNCPPPAARSPLLRPWQAGIEQRISASETLALQTINSVLRDHNAPRREFATDMYRDLPTILCTFAELDHFESRPPGADYFGMLPDWRTAQQSPPTDASVGSNAGPFDIFVYTRNNSDTAPLVAALAKRAERTLVYCPNLSEADRQRLGSDKVTFASNAVDVPRLLDELKLVVSYAGHNLAAETLLAGKPMLLMPMHLEQSLVASNIVRLGAGRAIEVTERHPKFSRYLDDLLGNSGYATAAKQFAARYQDATPAASLQRALFQCQTAVKSVYPVSNFLTAVR